MKYDVVNLTDKSVGSVELSDKVSEKVKKAVLYYAVKADRNNRRHGTVKVKSRGEVAKTGKKSIRQKGTGGARHAQRSANIFVGGGNVHGPQPRRYFESLTKKTKHAAYREALKFLIQNKSLKLVDEFAFKKPSTKDAAKALHAFGFKKTLVLLPQGADNAECSFRNLRDVTVVWENNISVYELLRSDSVVMTQAFFAELKERVGL
jgi:large subunit ribosomal protein L4